MVAVSAAAIIACLGPTQIKLRLTTDIPCDVVTRSGATIHSGDASEPPVAAPRTCTQASSTNEIGTLVLTPSGERDERITTTVVLGVGVATDQCAADGYKQCIVAKRRVRYVPHEPLEMPIELSSACIGKAADCGDKTCFRGACISPDFEPANGCLGPECVGPVDADGGSTLDAGGDDAATSDATANDGPPLDAAPSDAATITDPVLFASTSGPARGLAIAVGRLYWTLAGVTTPYSAPLGQGDASVAMPGPPDGENWGIAVSGSIMLIAQGPTVNAGGLCGTAIGIDGGPPVTPLNCTGAGGGAGIAVQVPTGSVLVSGVDGHVFSASGVFQQSPPNLFGGYAKADPLDSNRICVAKNNTVVEITLPNPLQKVVATFPTQIFARGLAVSPSDYFLSQGDFVQASARGNGAVRDVLQTGRLKNVEDLEYDPTTKILYIAAASGPQGAGVYMMTVEPSSQ